MDQWITWGLESIYWAVLIGLLAARLWISPQSGMAGNGPEILLTLVGWINTGLLFFSALKGGTKGWEMRVIGFMVLFWGIIGSVVLSMVAVVKFSSFLTGVEIIVNFAVLVAVSLSWAGLSFLAVRHRDYLSLRSLILLAIDVLVMFWMREFATLSNGRIAMVFYARGELLVALGFGGLLWQGAYYLKERQFRWAAAYGILGIGLFVCILMAIVGPQLDSFFQELGRPF